MPTNAEVTRGRGTNTSGGTVPSNSDSAYQATRIEGIPTVRPPGVATSRSATSFWTITTSRCTAGACSSTDMMIGTATL